MIQWRVLIQWLWMILMIIPSTLIALRYHSFLYSIEDADNRGMNQTCGTPRGQPVGNGLHSRWSQICMYQEKLAINLSTDSSCKEGRTFQCSIAGDISPDSYIIPWYPHVKVVMHTWVTWVYVYTYNHPICLCIIHLSVYCRLYI